MAAIAIVKKLSRTPLAERPSTHRENYHDGKIYSSQFFPTSKNYSKLGVVSSTQRALARISRKLNLRVMELPFNTAKLEILRVRRNSLLNLLNKSLEKGFYFSRLILRIVMILNANFLCSHVAL